MKSMNFFTLMIISFLFCPFQYLNAQDKADITAGELTFTVRTVTENGTYSPKHVLAIWVEDANGFVKSRLVRAYQRKQYLYKWIASSGNNSVDATTGATLTSHQTHTVTWDCTALSGNEVPDGEYHIFVEYTDKHAQGPWTMVTFIKGPDEQHISPEDLPYLKDMQLDFIPIINGLNPENDTKNLLIYPNPGNGLFHIQNIFNEDVFIQIFDVKGKLVYNFNFPNSASNKDFILDLSNLPNGSYVVNLHDKNKHFVKKLIIQ